MSSIATSFAQFVLYALGMGMVIIALTVGMALFKTGMVSAVRRRKHLTSWSRHTVPD